MRVCVLGLDRCVCVCVCVREERQGEYKGGMVQQCVCEGATHRTENQDGILQRPYLNLLSLTVSILVTQNEQLLSRSCKNTQCTIAHSVQCIQRVGVGGRGWGLLPLR